MFYFTFKNKSSCSPLWTKLTFVRKLLIRLIYALRAKMIFRMLLSRCMEERYVFTQSVKYCCPVLSKIGMARQMITSEYLCHDNHFTHVQTESETNGELMDRNLQPFVLNATIIIKLDLTNRIPSHHENLKEQQMREANCAVSMSGKGDTTSSCYQSHNVDLCLR
jgi:hypothetical protein